MTALLLAVVVFGLVQLRSYLRAGSGANAVTTATLGGLTAAVQEANWLGMDMSGFMPGYQMPASMMPGMPADGYERFAVKVAIVNTGGGTRQIHAEEEFSLRTAKDGKVWAAEATTFGTLPRLGPDNGITGELYFDLPEAELVDFAAWIEWASPSGTAALRIPVTAEPSHVHPA